MTREQKIKTLKLLEEYDSRVKYNKIHSIFPDDGPLAYYNYAKHMKLFAAGKDYNERAFIAGNRSGKSLAAGCELVYHLTGLYPHWWTGKRFNRAINAWAVGKSSHTTRDIIQEILLGNPRDVGTGLIPKSLIHDTTRKAGAGQDYINDIYVKHITGDLSVVTLKAYDQERQAFEGTAKDFIWLDEECPQDIYSECLTRTMTCKGCVLLTFTPLQGLTPTVLSFLPGGMFPRTSDMCGPVEAAV